MSPCCVAARDFDINSSVTDSENSSMHECVRFESLRLLATFARNSFAIPDSLVVPSRSPVALERLGRWPWGGRRFQKLFHDLSRLSTDHGVWPLISLYFFFNFFWEFSYLLHGR